MTVLQTLRTGSGAGPDDLQIPPMPAAPAPAVPDAPALAPAVQDAPAPVSVVVPFPGGRFVSEDSWAKRFGAWGSLFVTAVIFGLLAMGLVISSGAADPPIAFTNLMETIKALSMVAAGFWLGSSSSSQKKDDTIAAGTAALAVSTPPGGKPDGTTTTITTTTPTLTQ